MTVATDMTVTFWGVRGSTSTPGNATMFYGGHTPCVAVSCGGRILVFDAGTGIIPLGESLPDGGTFDLFLSHSHYDHIEGLPFFRPLYDRTAKVRLWTGHLGTEGASEMLVRDFMRPPFFPVGPEVMRADLDYRDFLPGDALSPARGIEVTTAALNHPGGGVGYRVNFGGKAFCYLSDHEHGVPGCDAVLAEFAKGADLVVYDAMYNDDNYPVFIGFGHSTWEEAIRFAERAEVERIALFHHHPDADDKMLAAVEKAAKRRMSGALVAREGASIRL